MKRIADTLVLEECDFKPDAEALGIPWFDALDSIVLDTARDYGRVAFRGHLVKNGGGSACTPMEALWNWPAPIPPGVIDPPTPPRQSTDPEYGHYIIAQCCPDTDLAGAMTDAFGREVRANPKFKPNADPRVHRTLAAAEAELTRLASVEPEKVFTLFRAVKTVQSEGVEGQPQLAEILARHCGGGGTFSPEQARSIIHAVESHTDHAATLKEVVL